VAIGNKTTPFALGAKAQILKKKQGDDGKCIMELDNIGLRSVARTSAAMQVARRLPSAGP